MGGAIRIENFEISFSGEEPMLSFDLPEGLLERFPTGLSGIPDCRLEGDSAVLGYEEAALEFPGAPKRMLLSGKALLCAQMGRGEIIAAEFARERR